MLSDELHLLVHPFRGYRVMATRQDPQPRGTLLERVLVTQVVLAGAVSLLTAGRMSLRLMLGTMLAWLMVPVIQLAVIMLTHWVSGTRRSRIETASLYMAGNAPPLLMRSFVLPVAVVVTRVFGWVLSYACYRSALELSRGRAAVCLVVDMLFASLLVIGWYVSIDNIIPQLTGAP
jgi:hypothetical protein